MFSAESTGKLAVHSDNRFSPQAETTEAESFALIDVVKGTVLPDSSGLQREKV